MLDSASQIYMISAGAGSIFLFLSALMGQMHHSGSLHGHGHTDSLGQHGHGHNFGHGHGAHHAAHSHSGGHNDSGTHNDLSAEAQANQLKLTAQQATNILLHKQGRKKSDPVRLILSYLSPMTIACFLAFFGVTGLFLHAFLPALGMLSVAPAILIALFVNRLVLNFMGAMMEKMFVSSEAKTEEIVGQIGEVCAAIEPGRMGEIVYTINSVRYNASARAPKLERALKRGAKVMIADFRDHVAYVEPWNDTTMDVDYTDNH